jgi:hypothetical protein
MHTLDNHVSALHKDLSLNLQKHKGLFSLSQAPGMKKTISRHGNSATVSLPETDLDGGFGYVEGYLNYVITEKGEYEYSDYSFKFFSRKDKIQLVVDGIVKDTKPFGFRFEFNKSQASENHPEAHLQFELTDKPRFPQHYKTEVDAFIDFLKTISDTFFAKGACCDSIFGTQ